MAEVVSKQQHLSSGSFKVSPLQSRPLQTWQRLGCPTHPNADDSRHHLSQADMCFASACSSLTPICWIAKDFGSAGAARGRTQSTALPSSGSCVSSPLSGHMAICLAPANPLSRCPDMHYARHLQYRFMWPLCSGRIWFSVLKNMIDRPVHPQRWCMMAVVWLGCEAPSTYERRAARTWCDMQLCMSSLIAVSWRPTAVCVGAWLGLLTKYCWS